jgi:hypothetical protein
MYFVDSTQTQNFCYLIYIMIYSCSCSLELENSKCLHFSFAVYTEEYLRDVS